MPKDMLLENFLHLHQPVLNLENIQKINACRLGPVNAANNLDLPQQIVFSKPRDGTLVRLADSYLEITFSYNTQTPAGTNADAADITFENDVVSKMFDTVELFIGGSPVETVYWNNVATEIVGTVLYSSDDDKASGASFGWIPDYGAGSSELTVDTLIPALTLVTALPNTVAMNTAIRALVWSGAIVNNSGYYRRKIFYNKPQAVLGGLGAGTGRTCTLCVPLGHFFQSVTSYDKIIYNMNFELRLSRSGAAIGRLVYSQVTPAATSMTFTTTGVNWVIPQYTLNETGKAKFYKQAKTPKEMLTLIRVTPPKSTITGTATQPTIDLEARASVPRYILVGFKNNTVGGVNQVDQIIVNRSLFTHAHVTDIYIALGSERYPYSPLQCDFTNNKYAMAYQMFREFCNKMGVSTSLDYIDYRDRFPIYCFDLTARPSLLDSNTTSINVQLNITRNPPVAADTVDVYCVLFCEKLFTLDYVAGTCTSSQRV